MQPAMAVSLSTDRAGYFAGTTLSNAAIQRRLCFYGSMGRLGAVYGEFRTHTAAY